MTVGVSQVARLLLSCFLVLGLKGCGSSVAGGHAARSGILNTTYLVGNRALRLVAGRAVEPAAPGSASTVATEVHGEPAHGDLNQDGREDAVVFLVQETSGSGTFYYLAAALAVDTGYHATNAVFIGDRVRPRSLDIQDAVIRAAYDDRGTSQPMAAPPKSARVMYLGLRGGCLTEVSKPPPP